MVRPVQIRFAAGFGQVMSSLIQDLRRKFRLLESYGYASGITDIAQRIGKRPGTLLWWADGDAGRAPGMVPDKDLKAVLDLFMEVLVPPLKAAEALQLILGPASAFEDQLRSGNATPLIHFVRAEGDSAACKLIKRSQDMGLIETTLPKGDDGAALPVKAGEYFRIVIEQDLRHRHLLALQHTHMIWARVDHSIDLATGYVHLPGRSADGKPAYMKEERDLGYNLFLAIAFHDRLPASITAPLQNQITFDAVMLGKIAALYQDQAQTRRRIFTLALDIQK